MKDSDNNENLQLTLDQLSQTVEVMSSVIERLKKQIPEKKSGSGTLEVAESACPEDSSANLVH